MYWIITVGRKRYKFLSEQGARNMANEIFEKAGVVVGIERGA